MSALPVEILRRKRDGLALSNAEIGQLVQGIADNSLCQAQVGAFAMAVRLRGMDAGETRALTLAMRDSGRVLDWSGFDLPGPLLDKHSTGGVGDSVSLLLAPMLAACGGFVPMLSGRGLGHTGGTLDKLESLPGYRSQVGIEELQRVVRDTGLAIVGAGPELAPADARLYAVRDVTATVDSLPLIVASILSKKLAAGTQALVLDVKSGSGATLAEPAQSRALAQALVQTANLAGLPCSAWLSSMDQPLMRRLGNALELQAVLDVLCGRSEEPRLLSLSLCLGAELLVAGRLAATRAEALASLRRALDSGAAAERFARMVAALGGPTDLLEREGPGHAAPLVAPVYPNREGVVAGMDTRAIGMALVELGGGRRRPDDRIDPRVGISGLAAIGERVGGRTPLALVHAADQAGFERAASALRAAVRVADRAEVDQPLLIGRIAAQAREAA
jgi:thymidine phosphorylase